MTYKDLNQEDRQAYYWWRAHKDRIMVTCAFVVAIIGFVVLPALGVYIIT